MENSNLLKKIKASYPLIAVVIVAVVIRLLPHPPNMAPVGGLALFCGAKNDAQVSFYFVLTDIIVPISRSQKSVNGLIAIWHDLIIIHTFLYYLSDGRDAS